MSGSSVALLSVCISIFAITGTTIFLNRSHAKAKEAFENTEEKYRYLLRKLWSVLDSIEAAETVAGKDADLYRKLVTLRQVDKWHLGINVNDGQLVYDLDLVHPEMDYGQADEDSQITILEKALAELSEEAPSNILEVGDFKQVTINDFTGSQVSPNKMWVRLAEGLWEVCLPEQAKFCALISFNGVVATQVFARLKQ